MIEFKYISSITEDELKLNTVIPCIDEEGFSNIIIKNYYDKTVTNLYETDNLSIKLNRQLNFNDNIYFVHIIKNKRIDLLSKNQFEVIFKYIFKKITTPISDLELSELIISLEDYFKTTPDRDKTLLQIGLFGELFTIKMLYDHGYKKIIDKYHKDFYSKHDFELDEKNRLEIKTITGDKRIHIFKHNQLCRDDINVFVSSVMLEKVQSGLSLYDLLIYIENIVQNPEMYFALEKLAIKAGINCDEPGIICSEELAEQNIRFIPAENIPQLDRYSAKVDGLSNIQYESNCELSKSVTISEFVNLLNKL